MLHSGSTATSVPFVDVSSMLRWVSERGAARILVELSDRIAGDFARWPLAC